MLKWEYLFGFIPLKNCQCFNNLMLLFILIVILFTCIIWNVLKLIVKISEVLKNVRF